MPENNCKNEQKSVFGRQPLSRQRSLPATRNNKDHHHKSLSREELKLASLAISHNASLRSADMPISMMERAFRYARSFLDASAASSTSSVSDHRPSPTLLARSIKKVKILLQLIWKFFIIIFFFLSFVPKNLNPMALIFHISCCWMTQEFDSLYGPAWHCVVGKSFGSFVSHSPGGFVYFSVDSFSFLLFKTEVHLVKDWLITTASVCRVEKQFCWRRTGFCARY